MKNKVSDLSVPPSVNLDRSVNDISVSYLVDYDAQLALEMSI